MLFNSVQFPIFMIVVLLMVVLLKNMKWQHIFLLVASYYFYYVSSKSYVVLMLITSMVNFYLGKTIFDARTVLKKRIYLFLSIFFDLGMLGIFKYTNFAIEIINDLTSLFGHPASWSTLNIILPVGISFFTFQAMSYTLDIYFGKLKPVKSLLKFSLFISFFPQLVAGPIVRAKEFLPQLERKVEIKSENIKEGVSVAVIGFVKKLVFADNIGMLVNALLANYAHFESSLPFILAAIGFSIQVYCDFSGYSDIAIGVARIMGFQLPENFRRPFLSRNVAEFWRRWHITLSFWIRDYVYTPLYVYFSERDLLRKIKNIRIRTELSIHLSTLISFALIGLWHGAGNNFIVYGVYNGILISLYQLWSRFKKNKNNKKNPKTEAGSKIKKISDIPAVLLTFLTMSYGFIFFRVSDIKMLKHVLKNITSSHIIGSDILFFKFLVDQYKSALIMISLFVLIYSVIYFTETDFKKRLSEMPTWKWTIALILIAIFSMVFFPGNTGAFIYFQF